MNKTFTTKVGDKSAIQILNNLNKSIELVLDCKICGVDHRTLILPNAPQANNKKACCGGCSIF